MNLKIEKSQYRKFKPSARVTALAFGAFGIYVLFGGIEDIQKDKLILGYVGVAVGILSIYSIITALFGKEFKKSTELFEITDERFILNDSRDRRQSFAIEDLKHIVIPEKGNIIHFVKKDLRIVDFNIYHFSKPEKDSIAIVLKSVQDRLLTQNEET